MGGNGPCSGWRMKWRSSDPALVSSTGGAQTSIVHSLISTSARGAYPKFKAWRQMDLRVGNKAHHIPLALVLLFSLSSHAWAWGDEGHKVICEIAFRLAQPGTRAEIKNLISTDDRFTSFSDSCTWPDHPRQRASEHFVNLPRDSDGLHSEACPGASACVVTAIKKDFDALSSSSTSQAERLAALKFLGHWVGDIHQPLHVSFEDDRGGNNIPVAGICGSNLHATWDTCLVLRAVGDDRDQAATELLKTISPARIEGRTHSE